MTMEFVYHISRTENLPHIFANGIAPKAADWELEKRITEPRIYVDTQKQFQEPAGVHGQVFDRTESYGVVHLRFKVDHCNLIKDPNGGRFSHFYLDPNEYAKGIPPEEIEIVMDRDRLQYPCWFRLLQLENPLGSKAWQKEILSSPEKLKFYFKKLKVASDLE